MQIEERSAGDVTLLDLKGKMTLGEGDELVIVGRDDVVFADIGHDAILFPSVSRYGP